MKFVYSDLINKFQDVLETPKELIEETFNKPDKTDVVTGKYVSVKFFGDFYFIVVLEIDERTETARFLNAYRIYPKLMDGMDISRMKPVDMLKAFMEKYGASRKVARFGDQKFLLDRSQNVFFPGILDIDKYVEALKSK